MPDRAFLQTKYIIPPVPREAVLRPRLIDKINEGIQKKLVFIYSPPGYGKSTLLAQWAAQTHLPVAWLNLDADDNNQARFLEFLYNALIRLFPEYETEQYLKSSQNQPLSSEEVIGIFDQLFSFIEKDFVLVLDDFQAIETPSIFKTLQYSLERQPPRIHLLISSRTIPPLSINNLRVKRQVTEIHLDDLRFNRDEIKAFFNRTCERCLTETEIAEIEKRTEGWAACLQLAALSLAGLSLEQTHQYISAFTGSNRYVWEYLIEEVYSHFPLEIQDFLKKTSILRRLNVSLCNEVMQGQASREILLQLERSNLLIPLDEKRRWYRYPSMIADFLFGLLEDEVGLAGIQQLHQRASRWFEHMGSLADAVNHALAAQDLERTVILLNKINERLNLHEYFTWPKNFLDLPDEVLLTQPAACIDCAWSLVLTNDLKSVERPLQIAERAWRASDDWVGLGRAAGLRAFISRLNGDTSEAIRLGELSLHYLPKENSSFRNVSMLILGSSYMDAGRAGEAEQLLAQAAQKLQATGDLYTAGMATASLARTLIWRGQLSNAEKIYQQVVHFTDPKLHDQMEAGHIFLGTIYYEWNQLDLAEEYLRKELRGAQGDVRRYAPLGYITLASLHFEQGEHHKAAAALGQALSAAIHLDNQGWIRMAKAQQARLALRDGNVQTAESWAQAVGPIGPADIQNYKRYFDWMTCVRLFVARSRSRRAPAFLKDAIQICDRLLDEAIHHGRGKDQVEILALKALALWEMGERSGALETLQAALALGQSQNFIRTFIDEHQPMSELLTWALANNIYPSYVSRLQSEYHAAHLGFFQPLEIGVPPSPLSEREQEILQAIASGLSTQAIAEKLVISPMTVRTHIKNIFRKLEANNRTQAIEFARIRRLI